MKLRKILYLSMCMVILLCSLSFNTHAQNSLSGQTSFVSGQIYYLSTVDDLRNLAKAVNEDGNSCERVSFRLTNDITVNDGVFSLSENGEVLYNGQKAEDWEDIVILDSIGGAGTPFRGGINGNGYNISGLYRNPLIGRGGGNVLNLNIKNSVSYSNGILGKEFINCSIDNSSVEGIVVNSGERSGLFAGTMAGAIISRCYASGSVIGSTFAGGFAGWLRNCKVKGVMTSVNVKADNTAGGFAGKFSGNGSAELCAITGTIDCSGSNAGQFAAEIEAYIYNNGYETAQTVKNNYTAVKSGRELAFCAAFSGDDDTVERCYYLGTGQSSGGFIPTNENDMKTTAFVDALNTEVIAMHEEYGIEWGYFDPYFVADEGALPVPYMLHGQGLISPHRFGEFTLVDNGREKRTCGFYGCSKIEDRAHYHTWGEYIPNNDADINVDGTKTANCTKDGCDAVNTIKDKDNLRTNTVPLTANTLLQAGTLYTISNLAEWQAFAEVCNQNTASMEFALVDDISFNTAITPISNFSGIFDGLGFGITFSATNQQSIFAKCANAEIRNVNIDSASLCSEALGSTFEDCAVKGTAVLSGNYAGALIGYAENCNIIGCQSTVDITAAGSTVGGVTGKAVNCRIEECCNLGNVYGKTAGGLIGETDNCEIRYSFNTGDVTGESMTGGFAGDITPLQEEGSIFCCYSTGNVTGSFCGKFCGLYDTSNIFALHHCIFEGTSVSEADANGAIKRAYDYYLNSLQSGGISYGIFDGKSLGISAVKPDEIKSVYNSYFAEKFVGGTDGFNKGFMQLRRFHTQHFWGEYRLDSQGNYISECVCEGCRYEHKHSFENYTLNEDGKTETALCECGAAHTREHVHRWSRYYDNNDAKLFANGTHTRFCYGCGKTQTTEIPYSSLFIVFVKRIINSIFVSFYNK